ncbi:hypothetical protein UQ78_22585, partial [Shigella flexneri]
STLKSPSYTKSVSWQHYPVEKEIESGELIELPFGEQSQTITAMCAHYAGKAVSPAMHIFIQCVEECFVVA